MIRSSLLILTAVSLIFSSCGLFKVGVTEERATAYIEKTYIANDTAVFDGALISKREALRIAKRKVYQQYGFLDVVFHEKPYKKYYVGRYLSLSGTLKRNWIGGVFNIIIDRKDGSVKEMHHGK